MRWYFTHIRKTSTKQTDRQKVTGVGEAVRRRGPVHCWQECETAELLWKSVWRFLTLNIQLPHAPAIPLLSIHTKDLKAGSQPDTVTPTSIASLTTRAKRQTQPPCPSTDKWINKRGSVHTVEYYSAFKKQGHSDTHYNMDEPGGLYAQWNKPDAEEQISYDSTYLRSWRGPVLRTEGRTAVTRFRGRARSCCLLGTEFLLRMM